VAQLYPGALGSLSVASYDSRRLRGGILTRLHTAFFFIFIFWTLKLEFFLRPTVSRPVSLGIGLPFGTLDQSLFWTLSIVLSFI
jgi:hypothetical protein